MGKIRRFAEITGLLCLMFSAAPAKKASSYNDALKMHLQKYMAQKKTGLAAAVYKVERDGSVKEIYVRDFPENRGKKSPARLHLASLSKHFTGVAIARLENLNKLKVTDKVTKYVRDWPNYAKNVTIQHLLEHKSGLREYTGGGRCWRYDTPKKLLKWLNKKKQREAGLKYTPGTKKYDYTNTNYVVLARIVENISKMDFPAYMRKHIFKPLNMDGTQVRDYKLSKLKNILPTYKGDGEDRFTVTTCDFMAGDGGVYSHIKDLKKWSKFLAGHSRKYGAKLNRYLYARDMKGYSHGLKMGPGKKACGRHTRTHGGSWSGARTEMVYLPEQQLFGYVLCNGVKCGKTITAATRELLKVFNQYRTPDGKSCE